MSEQRTTQVAVDGRPGVAPLAAAAAALFAIAFAVLAIAVVGGPLPIDDAIRNALGVGRSVPLLFDVLNDVGGAITWDFGVAILTVLLVLGGRRREAVWLGGAVLLGEALSTAAKLVVGRERPPGIAVQDLVTQASFPSAHATRALITGALLVLLLTRARRWRTIGAIGVPALAVLMGLARILSGEHWPTDVVGGDLLGGAIVAAIIAVPPRFKAAMVVRPSRRLAPSGPHGAGDGPGIHGRLPS